MMEEMYCIQHFSHDHILYLDRWWFDIQMSCGLCNCLILKCQKYYYCFGCDYHIHKRCAKLPQYISNTLHDTHPLALISQRSSFDESIICCFYCEKPLGDEYAYTCSLCAFYMHITCGSIPLPAITCDGDEDHDIVQFSCHEHPMMLVELGGGKDVGGNNCFACQLPWSSPAYSCTSLTCTIFLHKSCACLPQKIQHPFHSHKPLKLQISKPQTCDVCCKRDCKLNFSCMEIGCNFKLGTECACLCTTVKSHSHDHSLSLVEKASSNNVQCDACLESYDDNDSDILANYEVQQTQSFLFRCMECSYNLHFLCGPLPYTIKYEYHIHYLILIDSLKDEEFDKYYCDTCEEERNPKFRVYTCVECKYTAHIHCMIPEIMQAIKGGTNDVELLALGENRWKLGEEMDDIEDHNPTEKQTIGDIIDTLTEEEKQKLIQPLDFISNKRYYNYYRNLNSKFDELESIENFHNFKEFFQSDYDYSNFRMEVLYYTAIEGLTVDDQYSRQEVVEVDGKYLIPNTLVPIFKTYLLKYGDDCNSSSESTGMKSVAATLLSIVIDKMCKCKVEDATMDYFKEWIFYLRGIGEISGFRINQFLLVLLDKSMDAYLGYMAIRCEKQVPEKLDMKIATLEAELERYKKMRDQIPAIMSQKSSSIQHFMSQASELKHNTVGDEWF
ncbi:uncharacterized protein LOC133816427 [Humulus lupulus]|uniref:uncharacterized protein LOC133816427 n=1 Tax=Humulus lupulus TaxID=3486 RepID=UPI002B408075|nr:uncharacterized protein LOC133816427 [Humulus lupulus]